MRPANRPGGCISVAAATANPLSTRSATLSRLLVTIIFASRRGPDDELSDACRRFGTGAVSGHDRAFGAGRDGVDRGAGAACGSAVGVGGARAGCRDRRPDGGL